MDQMILPPADLAALGFFALLWIGYTVLSEHRSLQGRSLSAVMTRHRVHWLRGMCDRDNRVADSALLGNLMRSVSFFASASVLILGGLLAVAAGGDKAYAIVAELPLAHAGGLEAFEAKLFLLAAVFVYAFFQITWSLRQFNYCCVLVGAAPGPAAADGVKDRFSLHAARLQALAANSFNRGLRAYYFALAMLVWFLHPVGFAVTTALVVAVLYRREFRSKSLGALLDALKSHA